MFSWRKALHAVLAFTAAVWAFFATLGGSTAHPKAVLEPDCFDLAPHRTLSATGTCRAPERQTLDDEREEWRFLHQQHPAAPAPTQGIAKALDGAHTAPPTTEAPKPPAPKPPAPKPSTPPPPPTTAPPKPAGPPPFPADAHPSGPLGELLDLTNQDRAQNGRKPLASNDTLARAAQLRAKDLIDRNYFSHYDPQTNKLCFPITFEQVRWTRWTTAGENLFEQGSTSTDMKTVNTAFMNSPEHKANIIDSAYLGVGFGMANDANRVVVVELFSN